AESGGAERGDARRDSRLARIERSRAWGSARVVVVVRSRRVRMDGVVRRRRAAVAEQHILRRSGGQRDRMTRPRHHRILTDATRWDIEYEHLIELVAALIHAHDICVQKLVLGLLAATVARRWRRAFRTRGCDDNKCQGKSNCARHVVSLRLGFANASKSRVWSAGGI